MLWLWIPIAAVVLLILRLIADRDEVHKREELLRAIREELNKVRDDILKELRSAPMGK